MKEKMPFTLFHSHLDLAHKYWKNLDVKNFWCVDATCGNGHDTLFLARICSGVIAIDLQNQALENTKKKLLEEHIPSSKVHFFHQSHENFPLLCHQKPILLVVYNLGYLPGSDKKTVTLVSSTLKSLKEAMVLIRPGGAISITCYPGHEEGSKEEAALIHFSKRLDPRQWSICFHQWTNRKDSPSLLLFQKNII